MGWWENKLLQGQAVARTENFQSFLSYYLPLTEETAKVWEDRANHPVLISPARTPC
jgi:hypothetical protein